MDQFKKIIKGIDVFTLAWAAVVVASIFFSVLLVIAAWPKFRSLLLESDEKTLSSGRFMFLVMGLTIAVCTVYATFRTGSLHDLPGVYGLFLLVLYGAVKSTELLSIVRGKMGMPPAEPDKPEVK